MLLAITTLACCFAGCKKEDKPAEGEGENEVKEFSMFIAMPGSEINDGNAVQEELAKLYGAKIKETWLTGQTAEEAIGMYVAAGEYPDMIEASDGYQMMVDAGALIAIDEYWDDYPNIKNYISESEWNKCRKEDGHIYAIPQFGIIYDHDVAAIHNDEAWWIQCRVLKWDNYPEIKTMDQYFDLIERYVAENPKDTDGADFIPYTILCDDWRYFCLENAPMFLDGFPNDGCVNVVDQKAVDYNTTETAKKYFAKLNEEYKKGIVDPESFTQKYDDYIAKLSTGHVLGMIDQRWDFNTAIDSLATAGRYECDYIPLGIVIDEGVEEHYHSASALDASGGFSITTSCKDIEGALQFVNDMLNEDALTLRFWGIEGKDYEVGADGRFTRTQQMRDNGADATYKADNLCAYSYLPQYEGMSKDGINTATPGSDPQEFFAGLRDETKECLAAYDAETYLEMLNPSGENTPWFPLWSWSNDLTEETEVGATWKAMGVLKHEWLPKVCVAKDFDAEWDNYMAAYAELGVDTFLEGANAEIQRRLDMASGK